MSAYPPPNSQLPDIFNPDEFYGQLPQQSGGGSQTPWLSNINANGYSLITLPGSSQSITLNADQSIILNATNGNVGINTSSPAYDLTVNGSFQAGTIRDTFGDFGQSGYLLSSLENTGYAWVNPADFTYWLQSLEGVYTLNKVGIGSSSPVYDLDVFGDFRTQQIIDSADSNGSNGQVLSKSGGNLLWSSAGGSDGIAVNVTSVIALSGTVNTANLLPIGANSTVISNTNFTYDTANNKVIYNGASAKKFMVQTSIALRNGVAAIHSLGLEIRKNTTPISQARFVLASGGFYDAQDFNIIELNNGDELEWYYSSTNASMTLEAASQTGLTSSTTKPFQLLIWQISF